MEYWPCAGFVDADATSLYPTAMLHEYPVGLADKLKPGEKKGKSGTDDSDDLTNLYVEKCGTPLDESIFNGMNFNDVYLDKDSKEKPKARAKRGADSVTHT